MSTPSPLDRIRIVLVGTTHPGNIGAAARAMKTMGLSRLCLVRPRRLPDDQAAAMASGATDILAAASICATLADALAGTTLAVAMTARPRGLSHAPLSVRDAAGEVLANAASGAAAVVFGSETSGLSNEDVLTCQRIAHIPANPEYSSLNLAAAVQVLCYELRVAADRDALPAPSEFTPARFEDVERFFEHLECTLTEIRFLNPEHPKRLMVRLRRLLGRTRLEAEEIQILRGILKMAARAARHGHEAGGSR